MLMGSRLSLDNMVLFTECVERREIKVQLAQEMKSRRGTETSFSLTNFLTSLNISFNVSLFGAVGK